MSPTLVNIQVPYAVGAGPAVLGINNNGQIAGFQIQVAPTSPGVVSDAMGNLFPNGSAQQGASATLFVTGVGEVSPAVKTAYAPSATTSAANQVRPVQGISLTVGGVPAFVQSGSLAPGLIGTAQVNFIVPPSVAAGVQPVVVTVGGVASSPVNLTVQAPSP